MLSYRKLMASACALINVCAVAMPEQCLQLPERTEPCPHLIYKKAPKTLSSEASGNAVICVCLTDFDSLLQEPQSETERVAQQMRLRQVAAQLQLTPNQLLELVRY